MVYDPEAWRKPEDRMWALAECSKPNGMTPNASTTAKFLATMELEGLALRAIHAPVWFITELGRAELDRLRRANT